MTNKLEPIAVMKKDGVINLIQNTKPEGQNATTTQVVGVEPENLAKLIETLKGYLPKK